jgi:hypothetical protein
VTCSACGAAVELGRGPSPTWCRYCDEEVCSSCAAVWEDGADGAVSATCKDCARAKAAEALVQAGTKMADEYYRLWERVGGRPTSTVVEWENALKAFQATL